MAMLPELEMFDSGLLLEEPFWVAVPEGHEFATRKTLKQTDLQGQPLLLLEDGHCLRDQALEACHFALKPSNVNFRGSSLETIREMVRAGGGITIMPERATRKEKGIIYIRFIAPAPSRDIMLLWRKSSSRVALLSKMVTEIRE
jgi:LysR family hydrogen peroxide-inducible transcriptional activator